MAEKKDNNVGIESTVGQDLDNFETWMIENNKKILWACGGIVVIAAIVSSIWLWIDGAEGRSRKAFEAASTQEQIETALKNFDKGPAADAAKVKLARLYAKDKKYEQAAMLLKGVAESAGTAEFVRGRAAVEGAADFELAGKTAEAEQLYVYAADNTAFDEAIRVEASYNQGRLLAAKKDYGAARLAFRRAAVKNPSSNAVSFWSGLAGRALDRLPAGN